MTELASTIDLEEVIRVLASLGIEESSARVQLAAADTDAARLAEAALSLVESDAALLLSDDMPLPVALCELTDGLRQSGVPVTLGKHASLSWQSESSTEFALAFEGAKPCTYELSLPDGASLRDVVRAVANLLPRTHQLLLATAYEQPGVQPVVILDRGTYVSFAAAVGDGALERVFTRAGSDTGLVTTRVVDGKSQLATPDFEARFALHPPLEAATDIDAVIERVRRYDPRVSWPAERTRPPGHDFYDLCHAYAGAPLARCLGNADPAPLAQLLYRFALTTLVGAHCDMLASRHNPGLSAQGLLGYGQLTWAFFIFDALGAHDEAERAGALLDHPWVMAQERGTVALRQRAYYDLARWLRTGVRGTTLGRIGELTALDTRAAWQNSDAVNAALSVHTETLGEQLTHHALYWAWPAPLYALARRASASELLPKDNPFLRRPLFHSLIDSRDPVLVRLREQLSGFDSLDPERLPPLLDPLPVIVDIAITSVDGDEVRGHTLLSAHDEAEHHVVAPAAGHDIRPGEVWLLEVQGAVRRTVERHHADLGEVTCSIALPTGEWLEKAPL